ncbi:MAG: caspase family protein [Planctomycetota bacterium]
MSLPRFTAFTLAASVCWLLTSFAFAQSDKAIGVEQVREAVENLPDDFRPPNRYALLIGADDYADHRIVDLPACANDVRLLQEVLQDPQAGMFPPDHITTLTGTDVTKARVIDALDQLGRRAGPDDLVVVFFSGHGAVDNRQRAYWIMHETAADKLRATALPENEISDLLKEVRSQRMITLIDACFSAATAEVSSAKSLLPRDALQREFDGKGRVAITGSSGDELSVVITQRDHPGYNHSAFAWHVAAGMRGEADRLTARPDGVVTLSELWTYVKDRTARTAYEQGGGQSPQLKGQLGSRFLVTIDADALLDAQSADARRLATLERWSSDGKLDTRHYALARQLLNAEPDTLKEDEQQLRRAFVDAAEGRIPLTYLEPILAGFDRLARDEQPLPGNLDPDQLLPDTVAALRELQAAADQGDSDAVYFVGRAFAHAAKNTAIETIPPAVYRDRQIDHWQRFSRIRSDSSFKGSHKIALDWYRRAADMGNSYGMNGIGYFYGFGHVVSRNYTEALKWYRKAADRGNAFAITAIGLQLERGQGIDQNDTEAVIWYRKAIALGDETSMNNLGLMYKNGRGVPQNDTEAVRLFRRATELGSAAAMNNLGRMYDEGRGVARNDAEAIRLYRESAELGHAYAMRNLGLMFERGRGVTQDYTKALEWYRKGADFGNAYAMNNLGLMYQKGHGVPRDYAQALRLFREAATLDHTGAMVSLGWMYDEGLGVALNDVEAVRWYRNAAEGGNLTGMNNLGWMYQYGEGVAINRSEAIRWYRKAARAGNQRAQGNLSNMGETW